MEPVTKLLELLTVEIKTCLVLLFTCRGHSNDIGETKDLKVLYVFYSFELGRIDVKQFL